jgi:chromosome partitioning protein
MPKVISILQPKGGASKTTLSFNLADAMRLDGMDVVLVDSDPQGTARDWAAACENQPLSIYGIDRPELLQREVLNIKHDYVVIDGASKANRLAEAAVKASDLVLIPVQPSLLDVWASEELVNMIRDRQEMLSDVGRTLKAAFILTRVIAGTNIATKILDDIALFGLPLIEGRVMQRVVYPESAGVGQSVFGYKPKDKAAIAEISQILSGVKGLLA